MKVFLHISILFLCLLSACSKSESDYNQSSPDVTGGQNDEITAYIQSHGLTMKRDTSGMYYSIQSPGDSTSIMTLNSVPTLIYSRSNLKDSLLDASFGSTDFDGRKLKDHIVGWQIGLRKIGKGGSIKMIIPSRLGFGSTAVGTVIPANTILVCDVTLVDFK